MKGWLHKNVLTNKPDEYFLRIQSESSINVNDICRSAVGRGGANISVDEMAYAVNLWQKEMGYLLCDGFSINTGWFIISPMVKGVFNSLCEKFNPKKHYIMFNIHQGALLRKELQDLEVEILGFADTWVSIVQVIDIKSGSINDLLTPNKAMKIIGSKLKIVGDNPANGIYFVNQDTQERTQVDISDFVTNYPSELVFIIPDLPAGTYKIEVTNQFTDKKSRLLKEPRTAVFDKLLTVL